MDSGVIHTLVQILAPPFKNVTLVNLFHLFELGFVLCNLWVIIVATLL